MNNLNLILDTITDGIVVVDHLGLVLYANQSAYSIFDRKKLLGTKLAIPVGTSKEPLEINLIRRNSLGWAELRSAPLEWQGLPAYVIGIRDITERKLDEDRLRQAAVVFESTHEGVIITDAKKCIQRVNQAFTDITSYTESEVIGQTPCLLNSGRHDAEFYATMWQAIASSGHWQGEIWNRRKTGEVYPELLSISSVTNQQGTVTNYVGVFADISMLKASQSKIEFLAHHDPLTSLPNRLLLLSRLQHALQIADRDGNLLAVLMLDLDHFKYVNDNFGHLAGDELLQQVAKKIVSCLREVDTVCRLGGDEFTVLLENISQPEDAALVAQAIINTLSKTWHLSNNIIEVQIGVSIGISLFPGHGDNPEELLQRADAALYQAKNEGRGRFKYFSEEFTHAARTRINIETSLRKAIDEGEFRVFYQAQVDVFSGRIVGTEALLRWLHPDNGLISPIHFIALAEDLGLITQIGNWMLKETCTQVKQWLDSGFRTLSLAINVSPHQFIHSPIDDIVAEILTATDFPATQLELELTESALMMQECFAIPVMECLSALGVRLSLDNFGTGYSSLSFLKQFPISSLKIDKSFIKNIPGNQSDMAITTTIIAIAHTLGLKVIAGGVETKEQLAFLQQQGCDYYQGHLISQAIPASEFESLLKMQEW